MSSVRAFVAIPLSSSLKEQIAGVQKRLQDSAENIRWSPAQNLHMTLHFLGDIEQENLEKVKVSMLSVKRCHRPFEIAVSGLGGFPSKDRSRVIWLGMTPVDDVKRLHRDLQKSLRVAGFQPEHRPYSPHLTIGRARQGAVDLSGPSMTLSDTTLGHLFVDRMVLFASQLNPGGAKHRPLFTVNFDEKEHSPI